MTPHPLRLLAAASALAALTLTSQSHAELKAYEEDTSDNDPAVLYDIDANSGTRSVPPELAACPGGSLPSNTVFATGFTSGFAFAGDTLYGLEFDPGGTTAVYLYTMDTSFCAQGNRVSEQPIGQNLDSLAIGPDDTTLYSADFDTNAHLGRLLQIDLQTNLANPVGADTFARDVWIVGLAYDRATGELFGLSSGFAARNVQELFVIDTTTGRETLLGPTGTAPQELQGLALDPSTSPARLLASGESLFELNRATGQATLIGGTYDGTVYALAEREPVTAQSPMPTSTPTPPADTPTPSTTPTPQDTPTRGPCFGDCDGDGRVTVSELIRGVNIALGQIAIDECPAFDSNGNGTVEISELIRAVNAALLGCLG